MVVPDRQRKQGFQPDVLSGEGAREALWVQGSGSIHARLLGDVGMFERYILTTSSHHDLPNQYSTNLPHYPQIPKTSS